MKILTVWFIVTQSLPFYFYFVPMGSLFTIAVFVGIVLLLFPNLFAKKSMIALLSYCFVLFFLFLLGNEELSTINSVVVPFFNMACGLLMIEYALLYDKDYKYCRLAVITMFVTNIIMIIITTPALIIDPNIVRGASITSTDREEFVSDLYYWIINYPTIHGLPCLLAPLCFLVRKSFKNNKLRFILTSVTLLSFCYIIFAANATTALFLSLVALLLTFLFSFEVYTPKNVLKVFLVFALALIFTRPFFLLPVIDLAKSSMTVGSSNYKKMDDIQTTIAYGDSSGDVGKREELYDQSKQLFFESPLFGTTRPEKIGHHSFFWDRLALLGLVFVIPLILLLVFHIRKIYGCLIHTKVVYSFGVVIVLGMLYIKNDFGTGTWLYFLGYLPLLCRYIDACVDNKYQQEQI